MKETIKASKNLVSTLTQTLFSNGFLLSNTRGTADGLLFSYEKHDRFGALLRYLVVLANHVLATPQLDALRGLAQRDNSLLIIIGDTEQEILEPVLPYDSFLARFGGAVPSLIPLRETFPDEIISLGRNELPPGLNGEANELFEVYVGASLQFMTGQQVIRYGKDRKFEKVPDGIAISIPHYVLYDAKAAASGFKFEADTIRQFAGYVDDFSERYREGIGQPYSFLCISESFQDSVDAIRGRSQELYSYCGVPLCCIPALTIVEACKHLSRYPAIRQAIDWKNLFARHIITLDGFMAVANATLRDRLATEE